MNQNIYRNISDVGFTKETYYILKVLAGCKTLNDVIKYSAAELTTFTGFTKRNYKEVRIILDGYGLGLPLYSSTDVNNKISDTMKVLEYLNTIKK